MSAFVTFTDKDGDPVHLKADTINGVYKSVPKRGDFFAHAQEEPAYTIVSAAAGGFTITQSLDEVMRTIRQALP
ncbi:hypothetical protein [Pseudarthrobacter sp. S9]|uniref:hypothetical protein n=1 Tax=Pseudarthrobacter sp. S9 TaxID=3418421 RepID=UPI003D015939